MSRDYSDDGGASDARVIRCSDIGSAKLQAIINRLQHVLADDQRIVSRPGFNPSRSSNDMERVLEIDLLEGNLHLARSRQSGLLGT